MDAWLGIRRHCQSCVCFLLLHNGNSDSLLGSLNTQVQTIGTVVLVRGDNTCEEVEIYVSVELGEKAHFSCFSLQCLFYDVL